jgi:hypothetical protein
VDAVEFVEFPLDTTVVAPVIYREWTQKGPTHWDYVDQSHRTTPKGVRVSREAARELGQLLYRYSEFIGEPGRYCRADVLVTPDALMVLEVNMAYVDGWGTALNLSRAAGIQVWPPVFADCFTLDKPAYQPELELLMREIGGNRRICEDHRRCEGGICVYGARNPAIDNKLHLARFAPSWHGELVQIPRFYTAESGTSWEDVPQDVYLKYVDKFGPEATAARFSVRRGKPSGKARSLRRSYEQNLMIAQTQVSSLGAGGQPISPIGSAKPVPGLQLVVMAANLHDMAGYVQYAYGDIITDDSQHGPLQLG